MTTSDNKPELRPIQNLEEHAMKLAALLKNTQLVVNGLRAEAELRKMASQSSEFSVEEKTQLEQIQRILRSTTLRLSLESTHNACVEQLLSILPEQKQNKEEEELRLDQEALFSL